MWMSKRCRRMMAERDEANSSLRHMMDENTELVKNLRGTEDQLECARHMYARLCRDMEMEIKKRDKVCADFAKENGRLRDDNKRLSMDRDAAIGKMEEAYAQYRELRDRVETLAHGAEELIEVMIEEMIGAVHGL